MNMEPTLAFDISNNNQGEQQVRMTLIIWEDDEKIYERDVTFPTYYIGLPFSFTDERGKNHLDLFREGDINFYRHRDTGKL